MTLAWSLGQEDLLGKSMSIYSSILSWRILWTEECGGLWSIGLQRAGHDWSNSLIACKQQNPIWSVSKEEGIWDTDTYTVERWCEDIETQTHRGKGYVAKE